MTETAEFAHVVLPGACFAEKEGTFTNTDRNVLRVRKAIEPPGQAHADWRILCDVAQRLTDTGFTYGEAGDVMAEVAQVTPSYGGISHARLDRGESLAWPCPDADSPGTPVLHKGKFTRGRGRFHGIEYRPQRRNRMSASR